MTPELLQISVSTFVEAEEAVAAVLERLLHQTPALYTDEETLVTEVSVYLNRPQLWTPAKKAALLGGVARLRAGGLSVGPGRLRIRRLRPERWVNAWKRHFRPFEIGGALLVKPSWSRRRPRPNQAEVTLDPGLSFGTGQHPTTRFCLEQVACCRGSAQPPSLLDIGTGSGILAIAAATLGYWPTVGFDCDPVAVRVSRANARSNGVADRVRLFRGDVCDCAVGSPARFHVVCANLLAELLVAEARGIARRVRRGGRLVLAGVLEREFDRVRAVYEALGFTLVEARVNREWRSGAFRRVGCGGMSRSVEHPERAGVH